MYRRCIIHFFFSSRRRHTRCLSDWSSDVCSSDLAFARLWPDASLMNLLDDSLSADLARDGSLTAGMTDRFLSLGRYVASTRADAILFTCSAFGPSIEAVARAHAPMPVLKPNEAMIEQAVARAHRIGLLATFPPTLASMPREFP